MRLDIRAKLVLVSLGLIAASLLVLESYLRPLIEDWIVEDTRNHLFAQLSLIQRAVEREDERSGPKDWDALADDIGGRLRLRVTLIDRNGRVLGDSDVPREALAGVENHRDRPEVVAALRGAPGFSQRLSATVEHRLVYASVAGKSAEVAVVRLAQPLERLEAAVKRLHRALLIGAILALAAAIVMSTIAAQLMSRALRGVTAVARRMSAGNLEARTGMGGRDEIGDLGRALDRLAENLSTTMAALTGERDLLGRILESMQEGVLVLDADFRIVLVNPALRSMLGVQGDVSGRTPLEAVRNAELQAVLDVAAAEGVASGEVEVEVDSVGRRRFMVHTTSIPGEPRGFVAVFVDVTDIRRLESMRKEFVANVSHELRTPVTAVRSAVETLRHAMPRDPDAALHFIDMIDRNAQRLGTLIEDLLDLSRIESREYRPNLQSVPLRPLAERLVALLRARLDEKGQHLTIALPPDLPPVQGDPRAVEQVLTNLVDNAIKYCNKGDTITVTARQVGADVRVEVVDTGPGVEPRHLPRLFERFYRVDSGRSRHMGGTGLGLSIVKHLVETMSGSVGVDSAPGKGSRFWFMLPTAR